MHNRPIHYWQLHFLKRHLYTGIHIGLYGGYPTFVISILSIGGCTAIIGDVAGHLGCFIHLKDTINAIAFVALGTSVPGSGKNSMALFILE